MVDEQGNTFGTAADTPVTAGTIGWLAPDQETSALFGEQSGAVWQAPDTSDEEGAVTEDGTLNEAGQPVDGEANPEEVQVDPLTNDPYAVDTVTGRTSAIAATGVDSAGSPIYEAPAAAGGGSFEVGPDAAVSSVVASGPIDTSTWDAPVDPASGLTDVPVTDDGGSATWYGGDSGGSVDGGYDSGGSVDGGYDSGGSTDGGYDSGGSVDGGYDSGGSTDGGYDSGGSTDGGYDSGGSTDGGYDSGSYESSAPVEEAAPAPVVDEPPPPPPVEDSG
jgi:hypothetical protein